MDITYTPRHVKCYGCHCEINETYGKFNEDGDFFCEECINAEEYPEEDA